PVSLIRIPLDPLQKMVDGLIRNAVENTPDGGSIQVLVQERGKGVEFVVQDHGIGLTPEAQKRIFEGFFTTQETLDYASKQPFDFNAGGKGADLLRMKIFSERYHFTISMTSKRCSRLPKDTDICPGSKEACSKLPGPPCDGHTRVVVLFALPEN
ncbi:MAG: sensor histidine kinase, partial [Desulfotignum sp.]